MSGRNVFGGNVILFLFEINVLMKSIYSMIILNTSLISLLLFDVLDLYNKTSDIIKTLSMSPRCSSIRSRRLPFFILDYSYYFIRTITSIKTKYDKTDRQTYIRVTTYTFNILKIRI